MSKEVHPLGDRGMPWEVSQRFGENESVYKAYGMRGHNGVDYPAPEGTLVRATHAGRVLYAGEGENHPLLGSAAGNAVLVEDEAGEYITGYAHLRQIWCETGVEVKAGQVIGSVGSTGMATGPHLHYEVIALPLEMDNGFLGRIEP